VHTGFWWGDLRERDHLGKMFKWLYKKLNEGAWAGLNWLWTGTGDRHEYGNEPLSSIKCGEFLDQLLASQEGLCSMKFVRIFIFRYKFLTTRN
jgi:hypothetical protein